MKIHETSKQTFLDFEAIPQFFELTFIPSKIALNENFISAFNYSVFHVFKVVPSNLLSRKNSTHAKVNGENNNYGKENEISLLELDKGSQEGDTD